MTIAATLRATTAAALVFGAGMASAQATHPVTGEALAEVQEFTYRVLDDFPSIDPGMVEDVEGFAVARDLFEGLFNEDAEGNLIPGVALEYDVSDDGLTYTFLLRDDSLWSNGEPVTAHDFEYAWKRVANPETASEYAWFLELMALENASDIIAGEADPETLGVVALDDFTLQATLAEPLPYFPLMLSAATTYPVPRAAIEAHGREWTRPGNIVSNGAYVLTEYVPQERLVRERNPLYRDNDATIIDKVTALIINDENVALTRYLAGELDMTDMPAGQFPRMAEQYPDQAVSFPVSCSYYYNFNLSDSGPEAFKDVRVRQALALALDRDIIVNNVLAGGQVPAYTFTHWAMADWDVPEVPMAAMTQAERNALAQELMAEAGYGPDNPLSFELVYNTSDAHASIAVAMGQMWKQTLGVDTTTANMEWATFLDLRGNQNYEMARGAWCADYNEASTFLDLVTTNSGYNDAAYSNPEVDAIMVEARTSENPIPLYQQVEMIIAEDMPIIPIYHYASAKMMNPDLRGWPVENLLQNWYSRDLYIAASE